MKSKYLYLVHWIAILALTACDNGSSTDSVSNVGDKEIASSYKTLSIQLNSTTSFVFPNGSAIGDTLEIQFMTDSNSVYYIEFDHNQNRASLPEFQPSPFFDYDTVLCEFDANMNKYFVPNPNSGTRSIFIYGPPNTTISLYISKVNIFPWWRTRSKNVNLAGYTKDSLLSSIPLQIQLGPRFHDSAWTNGNLISTIKGVRDGIDDIDRDWYSLQVDSGIDFRVELQSLRYGLIGADFFNDSGVLIDGALSGNSREEYNIYHRKYDLRFDSSMTIYMRVWSTFPVGYRISAYRI